ncbi:hypothetical protein VTN77DRAFT_2867 [Rasamsonia byssochlamydoides]|uniref:uncharacterized protein n=1 Tax=Rasamsonia byssochlamydoides TaxID=89139 RepID=UPI003742F9D1
MANKSRISTTASQRSPPWVSVGRAITLILLAAVYSPIFQRALSPVYGSTPVSAYHRAVTIAAIFTGSILRHRFPRLIGHWDAKFLPALAFAIPTIQFFLFKQSPSLGNPVGPVVTALVTFFPLVLLSVSASSALLGVLHLQDYGQTVAEHGPLIGSLFLYTFGEKVAQFALTRVIGSSFLLTCSALQLVVAFLYAATLPSIWVLLAIPSLLFSVTSNVHMPFDHTTAVLNSTLHGYGYNLVARQESVTGYISVLENTKSGFRAMRCDHSLLGGEWTKTPANYNPRASDPIYAVFAMLEAVRLVEPDNSRRPRADKDSSALVIGLGVGTTPAALISHGIDTTIVEIDPVVHKFATQYFHLPANHTAIIEDAVTFVQNAQKQPEPRRYDYIVHDVFTGGVEPVDLFTLEFLQGLNSLLKNDGVIAINYAGNLSLPSAGLAVRTIQTVFPSCRIFREDEPSSAQSPTAGFTNMVIFCKKTAAALRFRQPTRADFLGSKSRESYLIPKHEIDPSVFEALDAPKGQRILKAGKTDILQSYHTASALGHWKIMRTVLPAEVWENW